MIFLVIYAGDEEDVHDDAEEEGDGVDDLVAPVRSTKVKKSLERKTNDCVH